MKTNIFTLLTKLLVIILPFYVLLKVFFEHKLGINNFGFFIKEFIIVLLFLSLIYEFIKSKKIPKFEILDYIIFGYIGYGLGITLVNGLGLNNIIYGGRYDFMFLIVFLIFKHGRQFLQVKVKDIFKLLIISSSISLFFSALIKFRLGEDSLKFFGYVDYRSDFIYNGAIPIYHGLENTGMRRFQGIFDSPNNMAFFLIIYTGLFLHNIKKKFEYHIILFLVAIFGLIILTYSRSALLGIFSGIGLLFLFNIKYIYKRFKKHFIIGLISFLIIIGTLGIVFKDKIHNIILRPSSTTGHLDRMTTGFNRFVEAPLGEGLAESGPAYRSIYPEKKSKEYEEYYIPESWFIQQLTEGGIIYFSLFITLFSIILIRLYKHSKPIFASLLAILVMNLFLHTFEATYLSVLFFIIIGLLVSKKNT